MTAVPVLALRGIRRSFGPVEVLHGVDIALHPGEVHALIGENGAGKSTTMKIMAGYQPPSEGDILIDGQVTRLASLHEGEEAGIVMIHQEFNLAEQLTVEQNVFLGRELRRGLLADRAAMTRETQALLDRLGCAVSPGARVSELSNSDKQMVEIAKALSRRARVLVMDEPTAVLTHTEAEVLFEQVRVLRAAGAAILFTSHKLDEVRRISDRVTVMRDGAVVHSGPTADISEDEMATRMVGRDVSVLYPPRPATPPQEVVLRLSGLEVPGHVEALDLDLRRGEILGLAGLIGAGRTEAMEGMCGLRPARMTALEIEGKPVSIRRPADALAHGLCYLTEDRKLRGLLLDKGLRENLTLQALWKFGRVFVDTAAEERALDEAITTFDIRAGDRRVRAGNLSGGNQQKLLLAKTMLSEPRILVVDEPTRGIDIGTKQQIYAFLRELAAQGHAIIMVSSEMQEVIGLSDRVAVMRRGRLAGVLEGPAVSEEAIVRLAMGIGAGPAAARDSAGAGAARREEA
ncbi:monosaccharide ABC transporter ATP-binding protein, CUT2 family (TC 3.A.1.2.-) [Salipiger marinus]|uniref:Monosaccharide ABC transporter ATP-binding protein, CUT2 family (TC 3.A.1.2.-) n=1 Tax=Salipiger marinus TaxID=555512 RepID=A0A1G8QF00_9RHOB|nr:monosaccharide ABC transporter ATP-binding protein, CUT2 family (TC 3.A.1.2.-) [Salipiger marinus]